MLSLKPAFSLLSFSFIKIPFSSSLLSAIRVVSSVYLRLLIFLPAVLIPVCASSSPTFHMMQSESESQSYQIRSASQSCLTLCDPMNCSMSGLPVHHQLPEFTQTRVHRVGDAIQPSHPRSSPSPSAPNPSQHQGLFQ